MFANNIFRCVCVFSVFSPAAYSEPGGSYAGAQPRERAEQGGVTGDLHHRGGLDGQTVRRGRCRGRCVHTLHTGTTTAVWQCRGVAHIVSCCCSNWAWYCAVDWPTESWRSCGISVRRGLRRSDTRFGFVVGIKKVRGRRLFLSMQGWEKATRCVRVEEKKPSDIVQQIVFGAIDASGGAETLNSSRSPYCIDRRKRVSSCPPSVMDEE